MNLHQKKMRWSGISLGIINIIGILLAKLINHHFKEFLKNSFGQIVALFVGCLICLVLLFIAMWIYEKKFGTDDFFDWY